MMATLLSLAGINVNVKYQICSWQSGQKSTSWIAPGGGEHIYIYVCMYIYIYMYYIRALSLSLSLSLSEHDMAPEQVYFCGTCWPPMPCSSNSPNDKGSHASYFSEKHRVRGATVQFMGGLGLRSPHETGFKAPSLTTQQTKSV